MLALYFRGRGIGLTAIVFTSLLAVALWIPIVAVALQPGTSIHGVVTDAVTGQPIQGAVISAISFETGEDLSVSTNALGVYELATATGAYDVTCYVSDRYEQKTEYDVPADSSNPAQVDFDLAPYDKAFFGEVTNDSNGQPIASAAVVAESLTDTFTKLVYTNAQGEYEIYGPPGTYEISFAATGYQSRLLTNKTFAGTPVEVSATLTPLPQAVYGTVSDATGGAPISGALVTLSWSVADPQPGDPGHTVEQEVTTSTNASGYYEFYAPAGTYQVRAASFGFVPSAPVAAVFSGTPLQRDFGLVPKVMTTTISGVPDGWSNSDVTFTLTAEGSGGAGIAGTYYRLGTGDDIEYAGPVTIANEGQTALTYWSVDGDSNKEQDKTATIRIDKTPPTTNSNAVARYTNSATVKFSASDTGGSGVKTTKHRWGTSGAWSTGDAKTSTPGSHTLQYFSDDNAGNTEDEIKQVVVSVVSATSLTAKATPSAPTKYGATSRISGYLRKGSSTGAGIGGQTVRVQQRVGSSWMTVKTLTTSSTGYAYWDTVVRSKTEYRLFYAGKTNTYQAKNSAAVAVTPRAYVGKPSAKRVSSRKYKLSGTLKPRHTAGSKPVSIYLWRKVGGTWKSAGYVKAKASNYSTYSKYSVTYKFSKKGSWRLRAIHPADSDHAKSYSTYRYLTVK